METKRLDSIEHIKYEIKAYKKKFFFNKLLKGSILFVGFSLLLWLFVSSLEYVGKLPGGVRAFLFYGGLSIISFLFVLRIILPIIKITRLDSELSDDQ